MKTSVCIVSICASLSLNSLHALEQTTTDTTSSGAIPTALLGATVDSQYQGNGVSVIATQEGAKIKCDFQKLEGYVTGDGLWLASTTDPNNNERFKVTARAMGRLGNLQQLSGRGNLSIQGRVVQQVRQGITEEYSASTDGVRQDFVLKERMPNVGKLRVELDVLGAKVEQSGENVRLILTGDERKIAYHRLRVLDANGDVLPAKMEVMEANGIAIIVDDSKAAYPVRIDPTFSDEDWSGLGGLLGPNGTVFATTMDASGNLYIGGSFAMVGEVFGYHVAKWDGSTWYPLGGGISRDKFSVEHVYAMAFVGNDLYVGGDFEVAGGIEATNIARWDGTNWFAVGDGLNSTVDALLVSGTDLIVGGAFTASGNTPLSRIAKWNGSVWSTLGTGADSNVLALVKSGTDIYAGGDFLNVGGVSAARVARWNGSAWSGLGAGVDDAVYALEVSGGNLYAGGRFRNAGGGSANRVARWNGSSWAPLSSGVNSRVYAIKMQGSDLLVGGGFSTAGGINARGLAKWNGSSWSALATNGVSDVRTILPTVTNLFIGGTFTEIDGVGAKYITQWDGAAWRALGSGLSGKVNALAFNGSDVYAGGEFITAGNVQAKHVARRSGTNWVALGDGIEGVVDALVLDTVGSAGGGVFAGARPTGLFPDIYASVHHWNGSGWANIGVPGVGGIVVQALTIAGTNLYASGQGFVSRWDGASSWTVIGNAVKSGGYSNVYAMVGGGTDLYVGGEFTSVNGVAATNVARWNGVSWSSVGGGVPVGAGFNRVQALAMYGTNLVCGGTFDKAGNSTVANIASWNGSIWSPLGGGIGPELPGIPGSAVNALFVSGNHLFAGGNFFTAGSVIAPFIARWDGLDWSPLGVGVSGESATSIFALAGNSQTLFVGGSLNTVGSNTVTAYMGKANISAITVTFPLQFGSSGSMAIPPVGNATPYPWVISVSNIVGQVGGLRVRINNINHFYAADVDMFLMSPSGRVAALMSDAGEDPFSPSISASLIFDDGAIEQIPQTARIVSGSYRPADYEPGEALPPGGGGLIGTNLADLLLGNPNGDWKLFVTDDIAPDGGSISSWSLIFDIVNTAPANALSVQTAGGNFTLTWPTNLAGYILQSIPLLTGSTWTPVGAPPSIVGSNYSLTIPTTNGAQFFRLSP